MLKLMSVETQPSIVNSSYRFFILFCERIPTKTSAPTTRKPRQVNNQMKMGHSLRQRMDMPVDLLALNSDKLPLDLDMVLYLALGTSSVALQMKA